LLNDRSYWNELVSEALLNKAEYNFLDFKFKLSEKNDRLKEHINAFGNLERGGCFVFGVDNYVPQSIEGEWDDIIKKITSIANNSQEPSLNVDVFPIQVQNQALLCIHILSGKTKPVFIKDRAPLGGQACFKRIGSSTVVMSIQEIKDLEVTH
jgi:predicted HTH transcriptional regulator